MGSEDPSARVHEARAVVGFTAADQACLRAAWPALAPSVPTVVERLLAAALSEAQTKRLLSGPAQVARLQEALARGIEGLCAGPHDERYYQGRADVGRALARAHLAVRLLVDTAALLRDELLRAAAHITADVDAAALAAALTRGCDADLAMVVSSYLEEREQRALADLRATIVSHLPMSVILLDDAGLVTTSARASPRVFLDQQPNGKPWREVLQPALISAANLELRIERARRLKRDILLPRLDVVLSTGAASFRVTVTPLQHPMAEVLLHVDDLTDTIASEARATRAEQLAKLASMAATVAHEIRNPLAGVSAAVQVVAASLASEDARRGALLKVQEQVQRLGNLVGDLLSLSKPIVLTPREVDLAALASSVASSDHGVAEVVGSGAAIGDVTLLTQVLFSLVHNAWQADARTVRIEIDGTCVRVVDDGPGIPEDLRDQVFEPFFTTKTRGTGLGLPTARKIVEAMGGTLRICASSLGGACFEVQLQRQEGTDE